MNSISLRRCLSGLVLLMLITTACAGAPQPTPTAVAQITNTTATPAPAISPTSVAATPPGITTTPTTRPVTPTAATATASATSLPAPTATTTQIAVVEPGRMVNAAVRVPDQLRSSFNQERSVMLPEGLEINVYAAGLNKARFMALSPEGDVYLSIQDRGRVVVLPDRNRDGVADETRIFAEGLNQPHGLAFHAGWLYIAETNRVVRVQDSNTDGRADQNEVIVPQLPSGAGHSSRTIGFGPDGKMYVSVGSSCNICIERDERRAAIVQYNPDGSGERIYARGLRNAVGFTWNPLTGDIWATNNGRDNLPDKEDPPEALYIVRDNAHYGWPFCYPDAEDKQGLRNDPNMNPNGSQFNCSTAQDAVIRLESHTAPLGLHFYGGQQLPQPYQGNLFVALHGSWNYGTVAAEQREPKVVRVVMQNGQPAAQQAEDFLTGFQLQNGQRWGRPADIITAADGSLLISDDVAGVVYRVRAAQ